MSSGSGPRRTAAASRYCSRVMVTAVVSVWLGSGRRRGRELGPALLDAAVQAAELPAHLLQGGKGPLEPAVAFFGAPFGLGLLVEQADQRGVGGLARHGGSPG